MQREPRHKRLRDRAFSLRVTVTDLASDLGRTREHVSRVLSGAVDSEGLLDRIAARLDEVERERKALAA